MHARNVHVLLRKSLLFRTERISKFFEPTGARQTHTYTYAISASISSPISPFFFFFQVRPIPEMSELCRKILGQKTKGDDADGDSAGLAASKKFKIHKVGERTKNRPTICCPRRWQKMSGQKTKRVVLYMYSTLEVGWAELAFPQISEFIV